MNFYTCKFCTETFECKNKYNKSNHLCNCVKFKEYKKEKFTKTYLEEEYLNRGRSALEIAQEHGLESSTVINKLIRKLGIPIRGIKEACKQERKIVKTQKTLLDRYGVKHNFQKGILRKEWEVRLFEEYGITNVFQREDVKEKIKSSICEKYSVSSISHFHHDYLQPKIKETYIKKHGVPYNVPFVLSESNRQSSLNKIINEILDRNNIKYEIEFRIYDEENSKNRFYDNFIKEKRLILEVNGDYVHANPLYYKDNDLIEMPGNSYLAKEKWIDDKNKRDLAEKNGYTLVNIWETEIKKDILLVEEFLCRLLK